MKFSVITVVKDVDAGFAETATSVEREFGQLADAEHIIKYWAEEGALNQTTEVREGERLTRRVITCPDQGVFDAMLQALEHAEGEWVIFLNSGDWLATGFTEKLNAAITHNPESDVFYFDGVTVDVGDRREFIRLAPNTLDLSDFYSHVPVLHPCLVVRRSVLSQYKFDLEYDLAADFDLMVRLVSNQVTHTHIAAPGAFVISGGLSEQLRIRARSQATRSLWRHRRSLVEGLRVGAAYIKFLILHFIIVGIIHKVPVLQRRARRHTDGQPAGTY